MFQGFAQELQSEVNAELLQTLNSVEEHDWCRFGKVRQAWEKYLEDPDDVFIHAQERRDQLRKQGKKSSGDQETNDKKPLRRQKKPSRGPSVQNARKTR